MKTHDIAKNLMDIAQALNDAPNVELAAVQQDLFTPKKNEPDPASIPVALRTLIALSEFDRSQWVDLIKDNAFDIDVKSRDTSIVLIGKILKFLEGNFSERDKIFKKKGTGDKISVELSRALDFLLK